MRVLLFAACMLTVAAEKPPPPQKGAPAPSPAQQQQQPRKRRVPAIPHSPAEPAREKIKTAMA